LSFKDPLKPLLSFKDPNRNPAEILLQVAGAAAAAAAAATMHEATKAELMKLEVRLCEGQGGLEARAIGCVMVDGSTTNSFLRALYHLQVGVKLVAVLRLHPTDAAVVEVSSRPIEFQGAH
jgi:hypothetical protein